MRIHEILHEGGWASSATQGTHITPRLVAAIMPILQKQFIPQLNQFLATQGIPPADIISPAGSATYYQRDLVQDPDREYGDVDVQCSIARLPNMSNAANSSVYQRAIRQFCDAQSDYSTDNGTNVIMQVGQDVVQIDLIMSYYENQAWLKTLAPEYQLKGVLANSLYSSLGEALDLSFGGGHGVQVKTQGGRRVPFRTIKDVELTTITNNPASWAVDICKYLGFDQLSPILDKYPGTLDEVRVSDIIQSFRGIAYSMQLSGQGNAQELLNTVRQIYLAKIQKGIDSSKFDKAASPEAVAKAQATKHTLATRSAQIAKEIK